MMEAQPKPYLTPEQYLAIERGAEFKSEYFDGEMFAMAGASHRHNLITTNVVRELSTQLKGRPCETYASDMRVKVSASELYTYPDVVVACSDIRFDDEQGDTLLNPTLIVEVLSKSTEAYDRGEKFAHYRKLDSLQEYLLVAQDRHSIEHFVRQPGGGWLLRDVTGIGSTLHLESIGCDLPLAEVYDRVDFEQAGT
jgi:Uma2 family endonuclease